MCLWGRIHPWGPPYTCTPPNWNHLSSSPGLKNAGEQSHTLTHTTLTPSLLCLLIPSHLYSFAHLLLPLSSPFLSHPVTDSYFTTGHQAYSTNTGSKLTFTHNSVEDRPQLMDWYLHVLKSKREAWRKEKQYRHNNTLNKWPLPLQRFEQTWFWTRRLYLALLPLP